MPKVNYAVVAQVRDAFAQYEREVTASRLTLQSKATYILHASQFVRWLDDDFEPGSTLRHKRS